MSLIYKTTVLILLIGLVKCQGDNSCTNKETCRGCIQTFGCIWCINPIPSVSNGNKKTFCASESFKNRTDWCAPDQIYAPENSYVPLQNDPLKSNRHLMNDAVQIKPQRVKLSLRKGEEFNLQFHYRQSENYPVDLYYIMDLSASMEEHREKLAELGEKLADTMRNLTNNFKLGFGSYIDKTDMPFISTTPDKLKSPCKLKKTNKPCVPPYSFKNHVSLSYNAKEFSDQVQKAQVSGNLDFPEGGFDAVMQAMVCKNEIGWSENARHIIVMSTDADSHIAGDGKLAGVVEPNDAQCHMTNNMYTHDLVYDYPSVSQLNYVAKQNSYNLIFAIVANDKFSRVLQLYERLQERIENSAVGALSQQSSNVIKLIVDNYNKIVDTVIMTDNSGKGVEITYSSNCPRPRENGCTNIHVGEIINFTATIKPLECNPEGSNSQIIRIKPEGISESLEIELDVKCDCPCESSSSSSFVQNSVECAFAGDLACGVCNCHAGRLGRNCECDNSTIDTNDLSACKMNINDTKPCSGLGICKCGKCECDKRPSPQLINGTFCECNNYSCERHNGLICSGEDNGICNCGKCDCLAGWTGITCACRKSNTTCIKSGTEEVCSERGSCVCGECECQTNGTARYYGRYCEESSTSSGQRCNELHQCVECQITKVTSELEEKCNTECLFTAQVVDKIDEDSLEENVKICRVPDDNGCTTVFQYSYDENKNLIVEAQKEKICTVEVDLLVLFLSVIGSIVLAGLIILIIWKLFTELHDRREFVKFENEQKNSKWHGDGNPLYKKATSEFKNPLFNS